MDFTQSIWKFIYEMIAKLYDYLVLAMVFMVNKLMSFPLLTQIPEIRDIWKWMLLLSVMFIPLIFIWLCLKKLAGGDRWDTDLKKTIVRIFYMFGFILLTFPFVDWLVIFNNTIISALVNKYDIKNNLAINNAPILNDLVAGVLIIIQLYFVGKIVLGYYLRILEVNFAVIVSPALYVLWINQGWSGYIGQWITRIVTLIFSQFVQVLILVLYSQMFHKFINNGSWDNLFLALAALVTMDKVPAIVQHFVAHDSTPQIALRTLRNGASGMYRGYKFARHPKDSLQGFKSNIGSSLLNLIKRRRK